MKIVDDYLDFLQIEISKKATLDAKNALASLYKKERKKSLIQKILQGAPSKKQFVRREGKEEPF